MNHCEPLLWAVSIPLFMLYVGMSRGGAHMPQIIDLL